MENDIQEKTPTSIEETDKTATRMLIVDDEAPVRRLLSRLLGRNGNQCILAGDAREARVCMSEQDFDLILCDVNMPGESGIDFIRYALAEHPETVVIMVTGEDDPALAETALEIGAYGYVIKPFKTSELIINVSNALRRRKLEIQNRAYRKNLERNIEILQENARLREDIERITRHDLKAPLNGIINFPNMVLHEGDLSQKHQEYLKTTVQLGYKMLNMINLSLDLYKMEQGMYVYQPVTVDVLPLIKDIAAENSTLIDLKALSVKITLNGDPPGNGDAFIVSGEPLLFYSMLANIIKNAIEASPGDEQVVVRLDKKKTADMRIYNKGAVPEHIRDKFFDKYITCGKKFGTGLGTYSAKLIAETQGGSVRLVGSESEATEVVFSFPK